MKSQLTHSHYTQIYETLHKESQPMPSSKSNQRSTPIKSPNNFNNAIHNNNINSNSNPSGVLHSQLLKHYQNQLITAAIDQRRLQFRNFVEEKWENEGLDKELEIERSHRDVLGRIDRLRGEREKLEKQNLGRRAARNKIEGDGDISVSTVHANNRKNGHQNKQNQNNLAMNEKHQNKHKIDLNQNHNSNLQQHQQHSNRNLRSKSTKQRKSQYIHDHSLQSERKIQKIRTANLNNRINDNNINIDNNENKNHNNTNNKTNINTSHNINENDNVAFSGGRIAQNIIRKWTINNNNSNNNVVDNSNNFYVEPSQQHTCQFRPTAQSQKQQYINSNTNQIQQLKQEQRQRQRQGQGQRQRQLTFTQQFITKPSLQTITNKINKQIEQKQKQRQQYQQQYERHQQKQRQKLNMLAKQLPLQLRPDSKQEHLQNYQYLSASCKKVSNNVNVRHENQQIGRNWKQGNNFNGSKSPSKEDGRKKKVSLCQRNDHSNHTGYHKTVKNNVNAKNSKNNGKNSSSQRHSPTKIQYQSKQFQKQLQPNLYKTVQTHKNTKSVNKNQQQLIGTVPNRSPTNPKTINNINNVKQPQPSISPIKEQQFQSEPLQKQTKNKHYNLIDANRSYPNKNINNNNVCAETNEQQWLAKIQRRLKLSHTIFIDSIHRNNVYENRHLNNSYTCERMIRDELNAKICQAVQEGKVGGRGVSRGKSRKVAVDGVKREAKRRNSCRGGAKSGVESYRSGRK